MSHRPTIVVIDVGAATSLVVTQRLRELGVFSEFLAAGDDDGLDAVGEAAGVVVCVGDDVADDERLHTMFEQVLARERPLLVLGAGCVAVALASGARVSPEPVRPPRATTLVATGESPVLRGTPRQQQVWATGERDFDRVPDGFAVLARFEDTGAPAVLVDDVRKVYALQFRPEIGHSEFGMQMLENFVRQICGVSQAWDRRRFVEEQSDAIGRRTGEKHVLCPVSGGVDSMVAAKLVERAVGPRLTAVFVNTGLMRRHEPEAVAHRFGRLLSGTLVTVDATEIFLDRLADVGDAAEKRRVIEATFRDVLESAAREHGQFEFLVQATLYPDRVEGVAAAHEHGHTDLPRAIRGLPERLGLEVVEPLRDLFKDDVRAVGRELGIPADLLNQHPFPRAGLAIRVLGSVDAESLERVRSADRIFLEELRHADVYDRIWQAGCVLLPVQSSGLRGDARGYGQAVVLRAVTSVDSTSAAWARIPDEVLGRVADRILGEVDGVTRVVYDISSKPPATIEWE